MNPVVHLERLPHDRRIAAQAVHPEPVAQHQHRLGAWLVLAGAEGASSQRAHAEHVEEVGRDDAGLHPAGLPLPEENEGHGVVLDERLHGPAPLPVVGQLQGRELRVDHPAEGRRLAEIDEALPVLVGQRPQQHAADHAEDRGVGADAEREGQHGDEREAGALAERAEGEAEVVQQTGHEGSPGALARPAGGDGAAFGGDGGEIAEGPGARRAGPPAAPCRRPSAPGRACRGGSAARCRPRGRCRRSGRAGGRGGACDLRPAPRRAPRSPRGRRRASARPRCGAGAGLRGSGGSTWPHDRSR